MATTKKTTTSTSEVTVENTNNDMATLFAQMQEQMKQMKKELDEAKKAKEETASQNLDLQVLVDALKKGNSNTANNLPNYVTVISVVPNTYNLSTEENGGGTCFSFNDIGDTKIISLNNLQKIMGISKYRMQAEKGYFYMLEDGISEYFRIDSAKNTVETINAIIELKGEDCVDKFVALEENLRMSVANKIALDIANGKKCDRNKIGDILDKTGIDIETKARELKKIMQK